MVTKSDMTEHAHRHQDSWSSAPLTVGPLPEKLWMEDCAIVQEAVIKTTPKKKKRKKAKWLSEEALQIAEKGREAKGKGEKEIYPSECRVPENSKQG